MGTYGKTIIFLSEESAKMYSASGELLWSLPGKYRKAAIAQEGKLALLNPAVKEEINQVVIFNGTGEPKPVQLQTPVHDLIILPDGSNAVVIGDKGRLFYIDPESGDLKDGPQLPFEGNIFISDAEWVDANTMAFGVLHRVGKSPQRHWPFGTIIIIDMEGRVLFQKRFNIREATDSIPAVNINFESPFFIGFTWDTVILGQMDR